MDRPKAIEEFTRITGIIQTEQAAESSLPHLIDELLTNVEIIQNTNKRPPCPDCRARRMCIRNLAVPIITRCETCNKEIVFMVPVSSQDSSHWDHPVSRIAQDCPRAVRKSNFTKCPTCNRYPGRREQIERIRSDPPVRHPR